MNQKRPDYVPYYNNRPPLQNRTSQNFNPDQQDYYGNASNCKLTNATDKIHLRCLIPSRIAGAIIGKGGASVKKMRADYDVNIVVPESNNSERVILISKLLEDDHDSTYKKYLRKCSEVVRKIAEILQEAEVRFAGGNLNSLKTTLNLNEGPNIDVRILMNESLAMFLKDGVDEHQQNYIQKAMNYSNVKEIRIFEEKCPNSSDCCIKIVGQPDQIMDCAYFLTDNTFKLYKNLIDNGIKEKHYNTHDADPENCEVYGGFNESNNQTADLREIGKAAYNHENQIIFAVTDDIMNNEPSKDTDFNKLKDSVVFRRGPPQIAPNFGDQPFNSQPIIATPKITDINPSLEDMQDNSQNSSQNDYHDGTNHPNNNSNQFNSMSMSNSAEEVNQYEDTSYSHRARPPNANEHMCRVSIPSSSTFHLIGVDGSRLKEIEKDAGISININPPIGSDRIIQIGPGTQSQIYDAQYLLRRCIEDPEFAKIYDQPVESLENIAKNLANEMSGQNSTFIAQAAALAAEQAKKLAGNLSPENVMLPTNPSPILGNKSLSEMLSNVTGGLEQSNESGYDLGTWSIFGLNF